MLERDGIPYSIEAAKNAEIEAAELIKGDAIFARRAAEWAEERNKPTVVSRKRCLNLLKKNLEQIQQEFAKLGVTVISHGVDSGKGFEIKNGPLVTEYDKFMSHKGIKLRLKSILEAVSFQSSAHLVARCTQFIVSDKKNKESKK